MKRSTCKGTSFSDALKNICFPSEAKIKCLPVSLQCQRDGDVDGTAEDKIMELVEEVSKRVLVGLVEDALKDAFFTFKGCPKTTHIKKTTH